MSTTNTSRQSKADQQENTTPVAGQLAALRDQLETKVAGLRGKIETIQAKLDDLDNLSVPTGEYLSRIDQWIDSQAKRFALDAEYKLSALRNPAPDFESVKALSLPVRGINSPESFAAADASGLICFLMADELKEKLSALIEDADYDSGIASADRPKQREKLNKQLDELELQEESLICEAESASIIIPRRVDARPEIILSLELPDLAG